MASDSLRKEIRLRIGARGSPLAVAQAQEAAARLARVHGAASQNFPLTILKTSGDAILDRPLAEAGGKGLFTKEIDLAQLNGAIDVAVHSAKDLPTELPDGLVVAGYLPREDARDALISRHGAGLEALPAGACVGTASLRRAAQVKFLRADLRTQLLRGNVQTRLDKVDAGAFDATLLALAGLKRLGLEARASAILSTDEFLPAVGQGAIAIVARKDDAATLALLQPILDPATAIVVSAERAFLKILSGSCRTPIAGHAKQIDGEIFMRGEVYRSDGSQVFAASGQGSPQEAAAIGERVARNILERLPPGLLGA